MTIKNMESFQKKLDKYLNQNPSKNAKKAVGRGAMLVLGTAKDSITKGGKTGEVYLTIPSNRAGVGKITAVVQSALRELDAVTDADEPIKTGTQIKIVSVLNQNTVVVKEI